MSPVGAVVLAAFGLLVVVGPRLSQRFLPNSQPTVSSMSELPDHLTPQQRARFRAAEDRLADVLADAPGLSFVVRGLAAEVTVVTHEGDEILGIPSTVAGDAASLETVRGLLSEAGIEAECTQRSSPVYPGVVTSLARVEDVERLTCLVLERMPSLTRLARELGRLLAAHRFVYADLVEAREGNVWDLRLTLDNVRTVRIALGESDVELDFYDTALYELAADFARLLQNRLGGGPVQVTAYPSRGPLCNACHEEILEVGPLSPEQVELLTAALARLLLGQP